MVAYLATTGCETTDFGSVVKGRRRILVSAGAYESVKRIISTEDAPAAVGAYSQGTTDGSLIFTAGQIALTPDGSLATDASITEQTERCLNNVEAILEAEGASLSDVLKVTVFLDDVDDFEEMNDAYAEYFDEEPPARSAFEVGSVPKGAALEIEAVAGMP